VEGQAVVSLFSLLRGFFIVVLEIELQLDLPAYKDSSFIQSIQSSLS
jgi:hypothetical protein